MTDDLRLRRVTLDFRQRARAEQLLIEATDDTLTAVFEIIFLRDRVAQLEKALEDVRLNVADALKELGQ